jgi:hypothetical protein
VRAANIRALGALEITLERLNRMEQERIAKRQTKTAKSDEQLHIQLEYRINSLLVARGLPALPGPTE